LNITLVTDYGDTVAFLQVDFASPFQEAGLSLSLNDQTKMTRRLHIFEPHIAGKDPFDGSHSSTKRGRISIISSLFEALTTRYAPLQHCGINQRLIDSLATSVELVAAFDLHKGDD
jgi:hypothetical protein